MACTENASSREGEIEREEKHRLRLAGSRLQA